MLNLLENLKLLHQYYAVLVEAEMFTIVVLEENVISLHSVVSNFKIKRASL